MTPTARPVGVRPRVRLLDVVKVVISLGLIAYLLRKVDLDAVGSTLHQASWGHLALALVVYFGAIALGAVKWHILLRAQGARVPYLDLLAFSFTGLFFGNFLPTNVGGDLVRGYDLARYTRRPEDAAISVVVDRMVGLAAFISSAAVMSLLAVYSWGRRDLLPVASVVWLVTAAVAAVFAVVLSRHLRLLVGRLFTLGPLRRLEPVYLRMSGALQYYRDDVGALATAYVIGLGVVLISNMVNWLVAQAVHVDLPLAYIMLFNPMLAFAPLIIPSVGGLGVNQGAYDLLYSRLGGVITPPDALAMSLLMQLVIYVSSLPGGVLWLRKRRRLEPPPVLPEKRGKPHVPPLR